MKDSSDTPNADVPSQANASDRCASCGAALKPGQSACAYCGNPADQNTVPNSAFCHKCGYSLTGLQATDGCPQCGQPVIVSVRYLGQAVPGKQLPDSIPENALCRGCSYPLTGLSISDRCPECSRPVLDSIRGDELRFCDSNYLRSLHRGAVLIESSLCSIIILGVFAVVATKVAVAFGFSSTGLAGEALGVILWMIPPSLSLAGWYTISVPDPGVSVEDKGDKPRKIVRIAAVVNVFAGLFAALAGLIAPQTRAFPTGGLTALSVSTLISSLGNIAGFASVVAFLILFFAAMQYLKWIEPRIPDPRLGKTTRMCTWLIPILVFPGCFALCIGPLVAIVMFYNLLDRYRVHIKNIRHATFGSADLWKDPISHG